MPLCKRCLLLLVFLHFSSSQYTACHLLTPPKFRPRSLALSLPSLPSLLPPSTNSLFQKLTPNFKSCTNPVKFDARLGAIGFIFCTKRVRPRITLKNVRNESEQNISPSLPFSLHSSDRSNLPPWTSPKLALGLGLEVRDLLPSATNPINTRGKMLDL